jgi:hypothetical protein
MHDLHHEITVWFNLDENCVEGFSDNYVYKNGGGCGSWHDTSNEKFSKNYVCDEDEPWIEEAKIKSKLDRHKAKYKQTLYKSNYGDVIIQQEKKKWIILWSEEEDDVYITLDSTDELFDFSTDEDLENFPKEGKFKSELDAYNFIVNLFGKLNEAK